MLREYVPGLQVKYVVPVRTPARVMTDEHVYAVMDHVDEVMAALQANRSSKSTKVLQRAALRHVYDNWPEHLGRKRSTQESLGDALSSVPAATRALEHVACRTVLASTSAG